MIPGLPGQCLRAQTLPNIFSSPSHQRASWAGSCQALGTVQLPGGGLVCPASHLSLAQGSEEEELCTSEVTTSLSEEVLDLRGAERCQKGASQTGRREGRRWAQQWGSSRPRPLGK